MSCHSRTTLGTGRPAHRPSSLRIFDRSTADTEPVDPRIQNESDRTVSL